jgi:hypothetical protein
MFALSWLEVTTRLLLDRHLSPSCMPLISQCMLVVCLPKNDFSFLLLDALKRFRILSTPLSLSTPVFICSFSSNCSLSANYCTLLRFQHTVHVSLVHVSPTSSFIVLLSLSNLSCVCRGLAGAICCPNFRTHFSVSVKHETSIGWSAAAYVSLCFRYFAVVLCFFLS